MSIKPILKWAGGKQQLLEWIFSFFPRKIGTYYEPFLGGGSVLFHLLNKLEQKECEVNELRAYDINAPLISLYNNIKVRPMDLYNTLEPIVKSYNAAENKEERYYELRSNYNCLSKSAQCGLLGSAHFLILNKTCFRGLWREGPRGFNVPFGHYKSVLVVSKEQILAIHSLFAKYDVHFEALSFEDSLGRVESRTDNFIYLDPPYYPECASSFTAYHHTKFDHALLFSLCKEITVPFIMSNSNTDTVKREFEDYKIESHDARRRIHSKNPESTTIECLVIFI